MDYFFRLANPWLAACTIGVLGIIMWLRYKHYAPIVYCYSLTSAIKHADVRRAFNSSSLRYATRLAALIAALIALGRPQLVDVKSNARIEGIDMMLVLDVSGSMSHSDDDRDTRTRIDAAKGAAIEFIRKRTYDPIGLVFFGNTCIARCPLTLDQKILVSLIDEFNLGDIDHDGTLLATGVAMGVNRLKDSTSKSKVMILLTDGTPSAGDLPMQDAVNLAKQYGIKIYTIGVGSDTPKMIRMGFQVMALPPVNKKLLQAIAQHTGGKFFEAKKPRELQTIYDEIDALERTTLDTDIFTKYYELYMPLVWMLLCLLALECCIALWWFCV